MSEREERGKAFVAWMSRGARSTDCVIHLQRAEGHDTDIPVVVTPLLPDDPRPGEVWSFDRQYDATVVGAPSLGLVPCTVPGLWGGKANHIHRDNLHRKPVLKTYRLAHSFGGWVSFPAESREAALAKLAESLEEVTP